MKIKEYSENGINFIDVKKSNGFEVVFCDLGASMYSIKYKGTCLSVTTKNSEDYLREDNRFGKCIGRVCYRIDKGVCTIDGKSYHLSLNNGTNTLHGGHECFGQKFWNYKIDEVSEGLKIVFSALSDDGESGFPGQVVALATYTLYEAEDSVNLEFSVMSTTQKTPISFTNHAFYNLGDSNIDNLKLFINADRYVYSKPEDMIPLSVEKVPSCINFQKEKPLIQDIDDPVINKGIFSGVDHCFVLNKHTMKEAQLILENDNYKMEVFTNYPAVVCYSDNFTDNVKTVSSEGERRRGLAIEPQISHLDNALLEKGSLHNYSIKYCFTVKNAEK